MFRNRHRSRQQTLDPQPTQKTNNRTSGDIIAEFDEIFETSELKTEFRIKQKLIEQIKGNTSTFRSPQRARLD